MTMTILMRMKMTVTNGMIKIMAAGWNNGTKSPDVVKENISRGMVVYWIQRKEGKQKQD